MMEDYLGRPLEESIPKAQPKLYEYRERFKKRELRPSDLKTQPKFHKIVQQNDSEMDSLNRQGGTFFGPGTEIDF